MLNVFTSCLVCGCYSVLCTSVEKSGTVATKSFCSIKTEMNDRVNFCRSTLLVRLRLKFGFFLRGCLRRLIFHIIIIGSAARLNVEFLCESPIHSSVLDVSQLTVNHLLEYILYCCSQYAQARVSAGYGMTQVRTYLKWALAVGRHIYLRYFNK